MMRPYFGLSAGTIIIVSSLLGSCTDRNPGFVEASDSAGSTTGETSRTSSASDSTTGGESGTESGSSTSTSTTEPNTTDTSPPPETDTSPTTGGGLCGDGIVDGNEECDKGTQNGEPASGCSDSCTFTCGNGELDIGEECDEGDQNGEPASGCSDSCTLTCGNGELDIGEECDEGDQNGVDKSGCSDSCTSTCGNGELDVGEMCDDGNLDNDDGCEFNCTPTPPGVCGNMTLDWDELCDQSDPKSTFPCTEEDCQPKFYQVCPDGEPQIEYAHCDKNLLPKLPLSPFRAIGLACYNNNDSISIPIANYHLISPDKNAWRIASQFGTGMDGEQPIYGPREGDSFLALSTGIIATPQQGTIIENENSQATKNANDNPDGNFLPPGIDPNANMALNAFWTLGEGDPNDKILFTFQTIMPPTATGYSLDIAFLTSEWPEYVNTKYSDLLLIWEISENWNGPVSMISDQLLSSTSLHPHWSNTSISDGPNKNCMEFDSEGPGYSCNEDQLQDTGFEWHAGSTWLQVNQNLNSDKPFTLFILLADMVDDERASVALIYNFRYRCKSCIEMGDPGYMEKCVTKNTPDENCCGVVMPIGN